MVEAMIAIAIIVVLGAMGIAAFHNSNKSKSLEIISDGLAFSLSSARADAIAGKGGSAYGIFIASSSYSYFIGSNYVPGVASNKPHALPAGWALSTSTSLGSSSSFIFQRLTGAVSATGTVTVRKIDEPSLTRSLNIGELGTVTVVR